ncbi:macrophage receptor MARCO-like [Littorina saxatilis]
MLTSQCDCQSYEERLDSLNASLIALQAIVEALVMDPPMSDLNGTLRLVNNFNNETNQGRLEIVINGEWGTICQDFWSKNDAIVACNQLGLPSGDPTALKGTQAPISPFGPGTGPIWLDNLLCDCPEASLLDCDNSGDGIGMTNCDHTEDVGVICKN